MSQSGQHRATIVAMSGAGIEIDLGNEIVTVKSKPVHLGPKAFRLLVALMQNAKTLQTKEALILKVWDGRAVSDAVLTTAMREVRKALKDPARTPKFIETVHGRGYRFLHAVQMTEEESPSAEGPAPQERPQGGPPQATPAPHAPPTMPHAPSPSTLQAGPHDMTPGAEHSKRVLEVFVVLSLLISLVLFIAWPEGDGTVMTGTDRRAKRPPAVTTPVAMDLKSVAVLPFASRSTEPQDQMLAGGLHDDLLTRLASITDLRVISRSSVMKYDNSTKAASEIAQELGVARLLEGAVQRFGDQVRVSVKLIDGGTDDHLWANNFTVDLKAENIFEVQADITEEIARSLNATLSSAELAAIRTSGTNSVAAYDAFYRGKRLFDHAITEPQLLHVLAQFNEALALDPDFTAAMAEKAHTMLSIYWYGGADRVWIARARDVLDRLEERAPDDVSTLLALGYYHYWGFRDYQAAASVLERASTIAPNRSEVWELRAYVARRQGRFEETLQALRQARLLNPMDIEIVTELVETYSPLGYFEEADEMLAVARALNPTLNDVIYNEARMWMFRGEPMKAYEAMRRKVAVPGTGHLIRTLRYALLTRDPAVIEDAVASLPDPLNVDDESQLLAELYLVEADRLLGRTDAAEARKTRLAETYHGGVPAFAADWHPNGMMTPVDLPGLLGDAARVEEIVKVHEEQGIGDMWETLRHWPAVARAFARSGANGRALDYIERYASVYGPSSYLMFAADPAFDSLRDEPRYKALAASFGAADTPYP